MSFDHIKDAINAVFRKRKGPNRSFIIMIVIVFIWQMVPVFGEYSVTYLYVQQRYHWEIPEYSQYITIISITSLIGISNEEQFIEKTILD